MKTLASCPPGVAGRNTSPPVVASTYIMSKFGVSCARCSILARVNGQVMGKFARILDGRNASTLGYLVIIGQRVPVTDCMEGRAQASHSIVVLWNRSLIILD